MSPIAFLELGLATLGFPLRARVRSILRHLSVIRVPLLMTAAAFGLYQVPQIQELFSISVATVDASVSGSASPTFSGGRELALLALSAGLLAFAVWHSARTLLRFDLVFDDSGVLAAPDPIFQAFAPRVLAGAMILLIALGFYEANGASRWRCLFAVAIGGGVFVLFAVLRRRLFRMQTAEAEGRNVTQDCKDAPKRTWGAFALIFAIVNGLAWWPENASRAALLCGPLPVLMIMAALFVMVTAPIVFQGARTRAAIFLLMFLWACGVQDAGWVDNHAVSVVSPPRLAHTRDRLDLVEYLRASPSCESGYFVSAEGGGIRAAAWTAIVLARLERELGDARFGACLVGASGVSGGSLGLASFIAGREMLLGDATPAPHECAAIPKDVEHMPEALECRLARMMTRDFITPMLFTMFTSDQLQRVLPWVRLPDRGEALETAFSRSFDESFPRADGKGMTLGPFGTEFAFDDLYRIPHTTGVAHWTPVLLLNTTEVHTGARVIQSGLALRVDTSPMTRFPGARDLADWIGPATTLVGAVHNSARFTFISPAGTVKNGSDGAPVVQLVDGGYFENSGATTLVDLIHLFRREAPTRRVVVIHISNDGASEDASMVDGPLPDTCPIAAVAKPEESRERRVFGELWPPPYALYMTREARGVQSRAALFRDIDENAARHDRYAWLSLRDHRGGYPLPLGWRIGDCALCEMIAQYDLPSNREQRRRAELLGLNDARMPLVDSEHCRFQGTTAILR